MYCSVTSQPGLKTRTPDADRRAVEFEEKTFFRNG